MEYADLKMQMGEILQLQTRDGEDSRRLQVRLIGYLPGASLLVTTPRAGDKVMIVREGQPYVVRVMLGNRIVGFTTTVLRSCARPYPYLHLAYPAEVEQITVRNAQRVRIKLLASLKNTNPAFQVEKACSGTLIDMSTSGALMVANQALGVVGDAVSIGCAVTVGGVEKLLSLPAVIRNIHTAPSNEHGDNTCFHGLELLVEDQQDAFVLHGFVYEQIVRTQEN
jgi:c-di-GMP-binding flagellar brake protein YcgR